MNPHKLSFLLLLIPVLGCGQGNGPLPDPDPVAVDVITWNLKDFPQNAGATAAVADLLAELDPEVLCVQEVYSIQGFMGLLAELPGYTGVLPEGGDLGLGILWKTDTVSVGPVEMLFGDEDAVFIREPLHVTVEVLAEGQAFSSLELVVLHLKAGMGSADESTRRQAMELLESHVRQTMLDGPPFVILGDFNEALSDAGSAGVFGPWTGDPEHYDFLTEPLARQGTVTFLPGGVMLDHMITSTSLDGPRGEHQPEVPRLDQQVQGYQTTVSDHLPVTLRLDFSP